MTVDPDMWDSLHLRLTHLKFASASSLAQSGTERTHQGEYDEQSPGSIHRFTWPNTTKNRFLCFPADTCRHGEKPSDQCNAGKKSEKHFEWSVHSLILIANFTASLACCQQMLLIVITNPVFTLEIARGWGLDNLLAWQQFLNFRLAVK